MAVNPQRRRQSGSAYLIVLLALVVLTILGLSLALVTQSEVQVGTNERTVQRVFFASASGIGTATARALELAAYDSHTFTIADPDSPAGLQMRNRVEVTPFYPILTGPCNLCEINDIGQYGDKTYYKINHAVASTAARIGGIGNANVTAQKTISALVGVEPKETSPDAYLPIQDPNELKKIKF